MTFLRSFVPTSAKALFAGAIAGLGTLAGIMVGDVGFADVTGGQWVTVLLAALVAAGGVYKIPYQPQN